MNTPLLQQNTALLPYLLTCTPDPMFFHPRSLLLDRRGDRRRPYVVRQRRLPVRRPGGHRAAVYRFLDPCGHPPLLRPYGNPNRRRATDNPSTDEDPSSAWVCMPDGLCGSVQSFTDPNGANHKAGEGGSQARIPGRELTSQLRRLARPRDADRGTSRSRGPGRPGGRPRRRSAGRGAPPEPAGWCRR